VEYEKITEKIIGCAFKVFNRMSSGYLESVYECCMLIELKRAGLQTESQKSIQVIYDNEVVGDFIADIFVEDCIIVELKSVRQLLRIHEAQLVNYLVSTGKNVGLLINFGTEKVQIKRKIRILNIKKFLKVFIQLILLSCLKREYQMLNIKVVGSGCANCEKLEQLCRDVVKDNNIEAEIEKITNMNTFADLGILLTPGLLLNGKVVSSGKVPTKWMLENWIKEAAIISNKW